MAKQYPWWLVGGTETCHVCTHLHGYEAGLHCVACDRRVCVHCVIIVRATRETWCPGCHAEERED